jgi:uncharacterized protein YciI
MICDLRFAARLCIALSGLILSFQVGVSQNSHVFVFLHKRTDRPELPKEQLDKLMAGHMANINRLAKEGKLQIAGPFDGGGGIFVFNSTSMDEVKELIATDPAVKADRWKLEILPLFITTGKPTVLSEPYEMVSYQFVRFVPNIAKFNIQELPELFAKHDEYLKQLKQTGNVLSECTFGDNEGGFVIIKGELQEAVIERDPAVQEGLLQYEIKKWWTTKGSWGEK